MSTISQRLKRLERLIDQCEYKVVTALLLREKRYAYWRSTREIRRGALGEP